MQEELKKRLMAQMEDVVREAANQVIAYGYDEAIKELTVQVRAPKRQWVGLTDEEIKKLLDCGRGGLVDIKKAEQILKEKNT
jgi:hypothetical protein